VFHEGARFYLGRRARQPGRHRVHGTAAETKATVRLHFDVIKGRAFPGCGSRSRGSIVSVFAYRPLEVAVETADDQPDRLARHGPRLLGRPTRTASSAPCPDFRINVYQMCKVRALSYVAGAEIPKRT
jgi:hypothetical protein